MPETAEAIITVVGVALSALSLPLFVREVLLRERAQRRREQARAAAAAVETELEQTAPIVSPVPHRVPLSNGLRPADSAHRPPRMAPATRPLRTG